jgi:dTMP kinase
MTAMPAGAPARGRFVVIDCVDGCGKSTQARLLSDSLARRGGAPPLHLREPGGTPLGERLRALFLERGLSIGPAAEALVLAAARRQMLDELVRPALAAGRDVVCERFHASTFAYQAVAGGLPEDEVLELCARWAGEPAPDVVVLLLLDPEDAARRRGAPGDRIEDKGRAFHAAVAQGYRRYAERTRGVTVIDGALPVEEVARRVLAEVDRARR